MLIFHRPFYAAPAFMYNTWAGSHFVHLLLKKERKLGVHIHVDICPMHMVVKWAYGAKPTTQEHNML